MRQIKREKAHLRLRHQQISSQRGMKRVWDVPGTANSLVALEWQLPRGICEQREHTGLQAKAQVKRDFLSSTEESRLSLQAVGNK